MTFLSTNNISQYSNTAKKGFLGGHGKKGSVDASLSFLQVDWTVLLVRGRRERERERKREDIR